MAKKASRKRVSKPSRKRAAGSEDEARAEGVERAGVGRTVAGRPSSLIDTRVVYCGDCLEKLADLPDNCVDLIYIDPPFNSNRNYERFARALMSRVGPRLEAIPCTS